MFYSEQSYLGQCGLVVFQSRFFLACLMWSEVMVGSFSLDFQLLGEWRYFGFSLLWSIALYFPDPLLIDCIKEVVLLWVFFFVVGSLGELHHNVYSVLFWMSHGLLSFHNSLLLVWFWLGCQGPFVI